MKFIVLICSLAKVSDVNDNFLFSITYHNSKALHSQQEM